MTFKTVGFAGIAIAMYSVSAFAHHSFSMFDGDKKLTRTGTVKDFEWTNPHSWLRIMVTDAQGQAKQWDIEMVAPGVLAKQGWIPKTIRPGMNVTAIIHPLKDGSLGGQFMAVKLPDGTMKVNPNEAPKLNDSDTK